MPDLTLEASRTGRFDGAVLDLATVMMFPDCEASRNGYRAFYFYQWWKQSASKDSLVPDLLKGIDALGVTLDQIHQDFNRKLVLPAALAGRTPEALWALMRAGV